MPTELILPGTAGAPLPVFSEVGGVAERAGVAGLILTHYLPAEPDAIAAGDWSRRAAQGFSGQTTAGFDGLRTMLPRSPAARAG